MNVSTVFPEGYVETERVQRLTSSIPKEEEGGFNLERYQRKYISMLNFMWKFIYILEHKRKNIKYNKIQNIKYNYKI